MHSEKLFKFCCTITAPATMITAVLDDIQLKETMILNFFNRVTVTQKACFISANHFIYTTDKHCTRKTLL